MADIGSLAKGLSAELPIGKYVIVGDEEYEQSEEMENRSLRLGE